MSNKRKVNIVVLSDVHLGTYGCKSKELLKYLKSINPNIVILNGDIIDVWQFKKYYWPKSHMKVLKHLIGWAINKNVKVYYITGNHDEIFRKFVPFEFNGFKIVNKLVLKLDNNKKAWFFHGDVFDVTMKHSKWLTRLGAVGYDILILINNLVNYISKLMGKGKISLSKKIKNSVKKAVSYINNFEETVSEIAIKNKYDYVICGHIHQPAIKKISNEKGETLYLNSGDWIENMSALEYNKGKWKIYLFSQDCDINKEIINSDKKELVDKSYKEIYSELIQEFDIANIKIPTLK